MDNIKYGPRYFFSEKDDNTTLPNSGVNSASPAIDNQASPTINEPSKDTDNPQATTDRPILFKLNRNGGDIPKEEHQKIQGRDNKEVSILYQDNPFPLPRSSGQTTSGPREWKSASYSRVRLNTTGNTGKKATPSRNESINNGSMSPAAKGISEKNSSPEPDQKAEKSSLSVSHHLIHCMAKIE